MGILLEIRRNPWKPMELCQAMFGNVLICLTISCNCKDSPLLFFKVFEFPLGSYVHNLPPIDHKPIYVHGPRAPGAPKGLLAFRGNAEDEMLLFLSSCLLNFH